MKIFRLCLLNCGVVRHCESLQQSDYTAKDVSADSFGKGCAVNRGHILQGDMGMVWDCFARIYFWIGRQTSTSVTQPDLKGGHHREHNV